MSDEGPLRFLQFDDGRLHPRIAGRRVLRAAMPWQRPPPRLLLDLSGRALPLADLIRQERLTVPRLLDRFEDAHLVWSDCFLLGSLFQNSHATSGDTHPGLLTTRDAGSTAHLASGIVATPQGLAVPERKLAGAVEVSGRVLFATAHEPHHWGLWLTGSVIAIDWFRRRRSRYDKLFLHVNHPNMQAMLDMLGIDPRDVIPHDPTRAYHFHTVDLLRTPDMDFHVYPEDHALFSNLAAAHGAGASPRRLFVSRRTRSRGGYRTLRNEDALIAALVPLGFTAIEPEFLPLPEQMRAFAEAEAIIGLGGGSMFNAVFCKPGTKVLDIESTPVNMDRHANLFASLGLDYGMIIGAEDQAVPAPSHPSWTLDLAAAMPRIREFLED
jgi:hypothetical protein